MHLVASITLLKERLTGITYIVCTVHVLCCIDPFLDPVDIDIFEFLTMVADWKDSPQL